MENGQEIKEIWIGTGADESQIKAEHGRTLTLKNEFHGDRDEDWVIVTQNCKETARHNCRYITSIYWG